MMVLLFLCAGCAEHKVFKVYRDDASLVPPCEHRIMEGECIEK